jgi:hypothetical protein
MFIGGHNMIKIMFFGRKRTMKPCNGGGQMLYTDVLQIEIRVKSPVKETVTVFNTHQ